MEDLKRYKETSYYDTYDTKDVSDRLNELSNLYLSEDLMTELENAVYDLKAMAQNQYNKDCYRVLYNVLLVITGNECF